MRSGQDLIRSPKSPLAVAIEFAIFFASTPITDLAFNSVSKTLAGAEGFEPPSSVLETDSLTVELTPLFPSGDRFIGPSDDLRSPDDPMARRSDLLHFLMRCVLAAAAA